MNTCMEHWWNNTDEKTELRVLAEKSVPVPLCSPKIPHEMVCY